jgi:4-carboxymuconolactone decarboxylase
MRLPPLTPEQYTDRQRQLAQRIAGARDGQVRGPFRCLLHSPELCDRLSALADFARFECSLPEKLREFCLLIAARYWDAQDSWNAHLGKALAAGLSAEVIQALAEKRSLSFAAEDERVFYQFCKELLEAHLVSDATYDAAHARWGDKGLVDAIGCIGTFSTLAMCLNAFEVDLDPKRAPPFADLRGYQRIANRAPLG